MNDSAVGRMKADFQMYLMNLDDSLLELARGVAKLTGDECVRLDHSLESLVHVERYLAARLDEQLDSDVPADLVITRVSSYMGEITRRRLGGRWSICLDDEDYDFGLPRLGDLPGYPKGFAWCPIQVVFNYRRNREAGLLKTATQAIVDLDF